MAFLTATTRTLRQYLALLQSIFHEVWVREYTSTMKGDTRYSPSDAFQTFPFPACLLEVSRKGAKPQRKQDAADLSGFAALREPSGPVSLSDLAA